MSELKARDRLDVPPLQLSGDKKSIAALTIIGSLGGHLPGNLKAGFESRQSIGYNFLNIYVDKVMK